MNKSYRGIGFIVCLIIPTLLGCSSSGTTDYLPQTACACEKADSTLRASVESMALEIEPYDSEVKMHYSDLITILMEKVNETEQMYTYCDSLYQNQGYCAENVPPSIGFYNYTTGEFTEQYRSRYTGNWSSDSIRNSISNPEIAKEVLLRIWVKEELGQNLS